ncbi:MAG: ATPase V [Mediterranea massiliensis]|nr:ATPase V [Mediterranea massiliensis]
MGKAKMKKLTFFVYHKEYHEFLQQMQELGVVHVQTSTEGMVPADSELAAKMEANKHLRDVIAQLEKLAKQPQTVALDKHPEELLARIDELNASVKPVQQQLQKAMADVEALKPWGQFDARQIEALARVGYQFHYCKCAKKLFDKEAMSDYPYLVATDDGKNIYYVVVAPVGEEIPFVGQPVELPACSLKEAVARVDELQLQRQQIDADLLQLANTALPALKKLEKQWSTSIAFDKVVLVDTERVADDKLMVLQGWVPEEAEAEVEAWLSKQGSYYEIRKPNKDDVVPVLFRNNAFTKMYEVLTKMYGMPNFTDFDPTPIVAPFFSLFFAFCMGDAGYGLVLILLGFLLKKKLGKDMAGMMNLVITLGIFTTIIGAFLGTFFGISLIQSDLPQNLKNFIIAGNVELFGSTYDKQMILALGIGVVHISIAMTVKAINSTVFNGFKESLSAWGWWLVVVGGAIIGTLTFLSVIPSEISTWAFIIVGGLGAIGIYLLNNLRRNVFMNIGAGLWDTYNMASGLMGDILSYIRLFALCLAGGMLGQTFNNLAYMVVEGQTGVGAVFGWIGFGLIIIFGHTLNIAMCCLSAFVHPLRLTFVEYFKNAGYEGKGVEYKPFEVKK